LNPAARLRRAWEGRICGCQLGKPVELLSMLRGHDALTDYLGRANALPLRDYVPYLPDAEGARVQRASCRDHMERAEPDDDINYSVLALWLLERHGRELSTADVARAWLKLLPAGQTYTAERAAYRTLLNRASERFAEGAEPGFDLGECADNPYNEWIGAQIRADVYGWVCPGNPALAARLAHADAALSHRGDGVHGAVFVAALAATLASRDPEPAVAAALTAIPEDSAAHAAVRFALSLVGRTDGAARIRERYQELSPVATVNNLAVVVWALYSNLDDFAAAIGEAVAAGLDTDCNGATVGGLWGLQGTAIPERWTSPWQGRVGISLAGFAELPIAELVARTDAVAERLAG
jgi:ADP-ribosylglycohydrolase